MDGSKRIQDLPSIWSVVSKDYELTKVLGQGSFGRVILAKCRATGSKVAIKLIQNVFADEYHAK